MNTTRIFLGWDEPLTAKVRQYLIPSKPSGPVNLGSELLIVPTRQAGRRLRETLAQYCAQNGTALLEPQVKTPTYFLRSDESTKIASPTEVSATWASLLVEADLKALNGLFPTAIPNQDFTWAAGTGKMIQQLRNELADGGYRIRDVYERFSEILEEAQRWHDLAQLESEFLEILQRHGKKDPIEAMIKQAESPEIPSKISQVIIAGIPDPTPLMINALQNIDLPIKILIHAPESMAEDFDPWGRPLPERWHSSIIDIPDTEKNLYLTGSPADQSRKALQLIAAESNRFGPADIAIGVPDPGTAAHLSADLEAKGLPPFDPAGKPSKGHPLVQLLETFRQLVTEGSYETFSAILRHRDVLEKIGASPAKTLEELDRFQNEHLPLGWDYIRACFRQKDQKYPHLQIAVDFIGQLADTYEENGADQSLPQLLTTIYDEKILDPKETEDLEFVEVAKQITSALDELQEETIRSLDLNKREMLALVSNRLSEGRYAVERGNAVIDLEGWLELPWNDAPYLIVTGMNEGMVPKTQAGDIFLPDSLRQQLNLRSDSQMLAVDIYTMRELIESRKKEGKASFITGKTSATGEPLKPSRLLFRCADEELPQRAQLLFGEPQKDRRNFPPSISFPLVIDVGLRPKRAIEKLSVTQFKDYLACPFRFYLQHILKMEALDDQKQEMDAMDFGSLVHHALHRMARSSQTRDSDNEIRLANFLTGEVERQVEKIYGSAPPLQVEIQKDAAKERLTAAAKVQAELVREGWEIIASERNFEIELNGIQISGRIDRIDRHRETGQIRILDYKTSEKGTHPINAHLLSKSAEAPDFARCFIGGKERRWVDLQLPLYRMLSTREFDGVVEMGYFNLPKAVTETGITIWEDFSKDLMASAEICVQGIVTAISSGIFWPPSTKVSYDEFAHLFPGPVEDCVKFGGWA